MNGITQTTGEAASVVNPIDDIASLLAGDQTEEEQPEEGQESADDSTEEGQESEGESQESEQPDEEDLTWSKALGVEDHQLVLDDEGNLQGINVKVDGETSTVSVKDLIAGYQLNKHVTQKSQALSQERKEFEQLKNTASQALHQKLQEADNLTQILEKSLMTEFESIDWNTLRHQNPGEYAALAAEYQNRAAKIQQVKAAITSEAQQMQQKYMQEQQQGYQQYLAQQFDKVIEQNPEWADSAKMKSDLTQMATAASSTYGLTEDEFAMINDARHISILKDALAYRAGLKITEKKLQNVPKMQKAGGKVSKPMSKVTKLTLNARKARGPQQRELQRDAVAALLLGEK